MINLEVMKNKLPEILCSKGLTLFQTVEIINRAMIAEKALELMAQYLVDELEEDTLPCTEFIKASCDKRCGQKHAKCWVSYFMEKAREQE